MRLRNILLALIAALAAVPAAGQAELMTKKRDIGDVSSMITKVVVSGDDAFLNLILEDEIERNWTVSPYEFCDMDEFDRLKCDTNYFFLIRTKGLYKNEDSPSIEFLSLLRGGPQAEKGLDKMLEVISLPFRAVDDRQDRYIAFLPAFVNIIQEHIPRVTKSDLSAYTAMGTYSRSMYESSGERILFCDTDLAAETDSAAIARYFDCDMAVTGADEIEEALAAMEPGTIVSYTIVPENGKFRFKMLVSTEDYSLRYFKKHRLSPNKAGFLKSDLRNISIARKNGK